MPSTTASHLGRNSECGSRPIMRFVISRPKRCSRWKGVSRMTRLSFARSSSSAALASRGRRPWRRARSMEVLARAKP
eukprot:5565838-Alexandrium_andersonii.AAC.1